MSSSLENELLPSFGGIVGSINHKQKVVIRKRETSDCSSKTFALTRDIRLIPTAHSNQYFQTKSYFRSELDKNPTRYNA